MLADFASLPIPELTAELERMQRTLAPSTPTAAPVLPPVAHPLGRAAVGTLSPPPAGPSRDAAGDFCPRNRAGAGDPFTVTRSGTGDPSPVDAAVRGDLLELPA